MSRLLPVCCLCVVVGLTSHALSATEVADLVRSQAVDEQLGRVEVELLIERAQRELIAGELSLAEGSLQNALRRIETLNTSDRGELRERVEMQWDRLAVRRHESDQQQHERLRRAAQGEALAARDALIAQDRSRFEERLERIITLRQQGFGELALESARILVADHPTSAVAQALYTRLLDQAHAKRKLDADARQAEIRQEVAHNIGRILLPTGWDGMPVFPEDWASRAGRVWQVLGDELPVESLALRNSLQERVNVEFRGLEPALCLDQLSGRTGLNMVVSTEVRADPGNDVTLVARNMRIDHVLDWIANQGDLHWRIEENAVFLSRDRDERVFRRLYDIGALLYAVPDMPGRDLGFTGGGEDDAFSFAEEFADPASGIAGEDLIDLIVTTLGEGLWAEEPHGLIVHAGQLLASGTAAMHHQLELFLRQLQDSEDIMVHVETHWLRLRKGFVEEIGVRLLDNGSFGLPPVPPGSYLNERGYDGHGYYSTNRDQGWTSSGVIDHRLPWQQSAGVGAGMTLSYGLLGSIGLAAVFEAVEQKQQARILRSMGVTVRNGTLGSAFIGGSRGYISDYEIVVSGNDSGYPDPVLSSINFGQSIAVRPLVSADRKYVSLDIEPALIDVSINQAQFTTIIQQTVRDSDPRLVYLYEVEFPIGLPETTLYAAHTRIMIPDRGSVLVGGFREKLRESARASVPVLGNIPFLGRLFGRRGRFESDSDVYLLTTARIIHYPELETQL